MDEKKELNLEEISKISGGSKVNNPCENIFGEKKGKPGTVTPALKAYGGPPISPEKFKLPVVKYGGPPIKPIIKPEETQK